MECCAARARTLPRRRASRASLRTTSKAPRARSLPRPRHRGRYGKQFGFQSQAASRQPVADCAQRKSALSGSSLGLTSPSASARCCTSTASTAAMASANPTSKWLARKAPRMPPSTASQCACGRGPCAGRFLPNAGAAGPLVLPWRPACRQSAQLTRSSASQSRFAHRTRGCALVEPRSCRSLHVTSRRPHVAPVGAAVGGRHHLGLQPCTHRTRQPRVRRLPPGLVGIREAHRPPHAGSATL